MGRETNKQRRERQATTAREKAAASRAQAQRAQQRRRALTVLSTVLVLAVVGVVIAVVVINRPTKNNAAGGRTVATSAVLNQVENVSDATLDTVGAGKVAATPKAVTGQTPLTANGKPELLYIGAEFCPYCAAERWSLAMALSKFGTLSGMGFVSSAKDDGNYASLDFYQSSYTSKYLTFTPVEAQDRDSKVLQKPTVAQNSLWAKLSAQAGASGQGYPFEDFGNKLAIAGNAPLDPSVLGTMTQAQIAAQLNNPKSTVAQTLDGGANDDIAAICTMTNNRPSTVCLRPTITNLQSSFNA